MPTTILIADDSEVDRRLISGLLGRNTDYQIDLVEDGRQALEYVALSPPDLVITDLMMPELDGLQLVRALRREHPHLPVILMTAYGNEAIAVEALETGAESYVPKARQAERLRETVRRVLERAAADRRASRLANSVLEYECRFSLENDAGLIRALVDQVQEMMSSVGFADAGERIRVGEALEEALLNAMYHGNLEIGEQQLAAVRAELDDSELEALVGERCRDPRFGDRRILVVVRVCANQVRFVIRDDGAGFSVGLVTGAAPSRSFANGARRGLTLIQSLMDEVSFNESGNELRMCKRPRAAAENRLHGAGVRD